MDLEQSQVTESDFVITTVDTLRH